VHTTTPFSKSPISVRKQQPIDQLKDAFFFIYIYICIYMYIYIYLYMDPCLNLFLFSLNIRVATIFLFSNFARIYHVWIYFTLFWNSWYTSTSSPRFTFLIFCATLPPPVVRGPWQLKTSEVITCQNQKKMIATWNYVYAYMHM